MNRVLFYNGEEARVRAIREESETRITLFNGLTFLKVDGSCVQSNSTAFRIKSNPSQTEIEHFLSLEEIDNVIEQIKKSNFYTLSINEILQISNLLKIDTKIIGMR